MTPDPEASEVRPHRSRRLVVVLAVLAVLGLVGGVGIVSVLGGRAAAGAVIEEAEPAGPWKQAILTLPTHDLQDDVAVSDSMESRDGVQRPPWVGPSSRSAGRRSG